ncbi:FtsX-like permease family protein [uncultured Maricaulis sp.]|uniref:ABC transporter permease n=1 Tax=uncultured Maricaulis sp. TaxID=174710 RepID=UPI0030DDAA2D|tara:strand:- start:9216 stop:11747 length:2532 start_codon:yes stop_codon:yes gene_type:complete
MNAGLAVRIAGRELRAGLRGFMVFLACLTLGVAAIAAAGSASAMFRDGVAGELSRILGGDLSFSVQRAPIPDDLTAEMAAQGQVSKIADINVMASLNDVRRLIRLRGVDAAYPLLGTVVTEPDLPLSQLLAVRDGVAGAAADPDIFRVFNARIGDRIELAGQVFELRAELVSEPDRLDLGFDFAPRLLVALDGVEGAGLMAEGSIYRSGLRVVLDDDAVDLAALDTELEAPLREQGINVTTRDELGDQFDDLLDNLSVFLAVAGLAALLAGGLGVAQAVSTFLSTRTGSIAALKALGADGATIRLAYLLQILVLALVGSLLGAALGALAPTALVAGFGEALPIPVQAGLYPEPLGLAVLFGMLSALAFALPAIGRARATPPSALLGGEVRGQNSTPWSERIAALLTGLVFVALAILFSPSPMVAGVMLGFAVLVFALLWGAAFGLRRLARWLAHGARGAWRLALTQLGGPGSVAPVAAPALGLGLALLAVVTLVQHNLVTQIRDTAPANLPSLAIAQIPSDRGEEFDRIAAEAGAQIADPERYRRAPALLGRITGIKGEPLDLEAVAPSERWLVDGETRLTYLAQQPPESVLEAGEWWPDDYAGPPLISIEGDAARGLGVGVGDTLTFRILGREITAQIASLRTIDWGGFGVNVAIVFAPGTLEAANSSQTALLRAQPEFEDGIATAIGAAFPEAVIYRVRERLQAAAEVFAQTTVAINAVAGVVALAGALVMLGAFAAAARRRVTDAALLKTFGVTPAGVLVIFALEFGLVGVMATILALILAIPPAWYVMTQLVEAVWAPDWIAVGAVSAVAILSAAAGGALVARAALSVPAARALNAAQS